MRIHRTPFRLLTTDKRGNIAIIGALSLPAMVAAVALGVDYGAITLQYRNAQTTVDLASIEGAWDASNAVAAVRQYLVDNNLNYAIKTESGALMPDGTEIGSEQLSMLTTTVLNVETGVYQPDPSIPVADRFTVTTLSPDAVRVTARQEAELYFASSFADPFDFQVSGTAAASKYASFWIGSRLASLNGGVINAVLGSLLGTTVSLDVADYEALLDADVDLFAFSETLAGQLKLTAGTYDDILNTEITYPQLLTAMRATAGVPSTAQTALRALELSIGSLKAKIKLADFIDFGVIGANDVGNRQSLTAYGNVMQIVSTAAALSGGERQVDVSLALTVPGLASAELRLGIGEPAEHSPTFASGGSDAVVRTAQARLSLIAEISGLSDLLGTTIRLPIFVEAADASANIKSISCGGYGATTGAVVLSVTPGLGEAAIGEIDDGKFDSFTTPLSISKAALVKTSLLQINGIADIDIGNQSPTNVNFSSNDIANRTVKTASTSDIVGSLTSSLVDRLSLEVETLGLSLSTPTALQSALAATLSPAATPLDSVLYNTLLTLGVRVGEADVGVTGVKCGTPVLVQ